MSITNGSHQFPGPLRADLHMHSRESDGYYPPGELVELAVENNLELIALTDHDTLSGLHDARNKAHELGCYFVDGVEVEATLQDDNGSYFGIHILGYGINPGNEQLRNVLKTIRDHRVERAREIKQRLEEVNVDLPFDRVMKKSEGQSLSRVHIAQVLKEQDDVQSIDEAFERYLSNGQHAYVPKAGPGPEELIQYIHEAGGLAVWAHPYYTQRDEYIKRLVRAGLDGIESRHSNFDPETEQHYSKMAREQGLFITGGSDYHGTLEENFNLGDWWLDLDEIPFGPSVVPK